MQPFELQKTKDTLNILCQTDLTKNRPAELETIINKFFETDPEAPAIIAVTLDLKNCADADQNFLRSIAIISRTLKRLNRRFLGKNASRMIETLLHQNGMESVLPLIEEAPSAPSTLKPQPQTGKINVQFINPFVAATVRTLEIQCALQATPGKIHLKTADTASNIAIAGVIGLTSPAFNGSIAICFPEKTFLAIMSGMLGENYTTITQDLEDGAGELLNIIFGQAKIVLNEKGFAIEKAIPTVVRGNTLQIKHLTPNPTIVLPFTTPKGDLSIEVGLEGPGMVQS